MDEELSQLDRISSISGADCSKATDYDDDSSDDGEDYTIDGKLELIIRQKNEEIDLLKQEIESLKTSKRRYCTHGTHCKCFTKSPSQSQIIKELKNEFEKSLENLSHRRIQVTNLQEQLIQARNEIAELKKKLRDKDKTYDRRDSIKELKDLEQRLRDHYEKKFSEARLSLEESKRQELSAFERSFLERLNDHVTILACRLKNLSKSDSTATGNDDMDNIFSPLKTLWAAIVDEYSEQMKELEVRRDKLEEAHKSLEESLREAKSPSRSNASTFSDYREDSERYRRDYNTIVEKLEKYRNHYNRFKMKYEREIENLRNSCSDKLAEQLIRHLPFSKDDALLKSP